MALIVSGNDQFIRNMIDERDNALARNRELAQTVQRLHALIRNINEVYINMDLPGLMSWDERTRRRVEIINEVGVIVAEMEQA